MIDTTPGALVRYREREWVVLPSDDPNLVLLRPIGGSAREVCGVVKPLADLMAYEASHERIEPAQFPLPSPEDVQDHAAVRLLLSPRGCCNATAQRHSARWATCRSGPDPTSSCRW